MFCIIWLQQLTQSAMRRVTLPSAKPRELYLPASTRLYPPWQVWCATMVQLAYVQVDNATIVIGFGSSHIVATPSAQAMLRQSRICKWKMCAKHGEMYVFSQIRSAVVQLEVVNSLFADAQHQRDLMTFATPFRGQSRPWQRHRSPDCGPIRPCRLRS